MAFRQPTHQTPQRIYTAPKETQIQAQHGVHQHPNHLADEQEWILFSPSAASTTDRTYTTSTARTRTAGHSRISDLGSLDTAARSYDDGETSENAIDDDEEDGELDSLDSHLHQFGQDHSVYGPSGEVSGTVLPTHDGLGSFRLDQAMDDEVQEHLYAFERFNPRRVKRRRESLELGMLELENERAAEVERTRRIEQWRMEQSQALVEEIQKETRRRKLSISTTGRSRLLEDTEQEDLATLNRVDLATENGSVPEEKIEGLWNRITTRVIRDLMGIDDDLLSIIFGESLPEDVLSKTPPASTLLHPRLGVVPRLEEDKSSWEYRLLERIARELGILVNQLSDHPGAFSTYLQAQQMPLPYAGLPVIPETAREQQLLPESLTSTLTTDQQFIPTLQTATQPLPIPISSTSLAPSPLEDTNATPRASDSLSQPITQADWERELDISVVFRYLRSRFTAKFQSSPTLSPTSDFITSGTAHLATASTADAAARAARVRQHHPLVTRQPITKDRRCSIELRTWKATVPGRSASPVVVNHIRRSSSSCASERLKRNSGSSRHYWDFGNPSVGSGSLIASTGCMGSWGEV